MLPVVVEVSEVKPGDEFEVGGIGVPVWRADEPCADVRGLGDRRLYEAHHLASCGQVPYCTVDVSPFALTNQ